MMKFLTIGGIFSLMLLSGGYSLADKAIGKKLYDQKACGSCHGLNAAGDTRLKAPSLAGQDYEYLARQLKNFKRGRRGYDDKDINGRAMGNIAATLSDQEMANLADYLNSLKPVLGGYHVAGNPERGKEIFNKICSTCHNSKATGIIELGSANLTVLNDWYMVEQIKKFRNGWRGSSKSRDRYGQSMTPNAKLLANEQEIIDVVSYIYSLKYVK